jgi:4-amino-4-deoxy-L-arabinose transferase-like glycosyltransferase
MSTLLDSLRRHTIGAGLWLWEQRLEALAFLTALVLCVLVRVIKLGSIPRIITGDEASNLESAYRIVEGAGPGFFGFDWEKDPILSLYPLAWSVRVFGNTVSDFRMYPVIFSLLAIVLFYFLARESMDAPAALGAMVLLGTNLWFLHFSRSAWQNVNSAFFAVGACWAVTRALKTQRWGWWLVVGLFMAGGLYGYFSARLVFVAVIGACGLALLLRQAPARRTLLGLLAASLLAGVLFAPMATKIHGSWSTPLGRGNTVSIFNLKQPYEGDTNSWIILRKNTGRNFRGFIMQDTSEIHRGIWMRYNPIHRGPLDRVSTYLFWGGLIAAAILWRKTYTWWPFFIPLFVVEVLSTNTPSLARGIIFAPFYFLFIGLLFDWLIHLLPRNTARYGLLLGVAAVVALVAFFNVRDYFDWQTIPYVQAQRLPGIDRCEFNMFQSLAKPAAQNGGLADSNEFDRQRLILDCSPIVRQFGTGDINEFGQGNPASGG